METILIQAEPIDIQLIQPILERMHIHTQKIDPNEEISDQILIDFLEQHKITYQRENLHSEVSDNEITYRKAFMEYVISKKITNTSVNKIIETAIYKQIEHEGIFNNTELATEEEQKEINHYIQTSIKKKR